MNPAATAAVLMRRHDDDDERNNSSGSSVRSEQVLHGSSTPIRFMQLKILMPHDITYLLLRLLERVPHSRQSPTEQHAPFKSSSSSSSQEGDYYNKEDFTANPDVAPLANLIFDKTHGNAMAVLQLLRLLEQEQLLYYSLEKSQWTWDDDDERMRHELTKNCILCCSHSRTTAAATGNHGHPGRSQNGS
jgi:hypothetical protein